MSDELKTMTEELRKRGYEVNDPWDVVSIFEEEIAKYAGSKYAVSVDNCTDALFLCLKYLKADKDVTLPKRTYMSVPSTVIAAGCKVKFEDIDWTGTYKLDPYPVVDGATRFTEGMYEKGTYHCLSFHMRKILPIGKGGMILTDDEDARDWFILARYSGRDITVPFNQMPEPKVLGWNMYMTPEQAAKGLRLFYETPDFNKDMASSSDYPDISNYSVYKNGEK